MKRGRILSLFLCVWLVLGLSSCSTRRLTPSEALGELLAGGALPSGAVYTLGAERGQILTERLLFQLYGDCEEKMSGVESGAVYLSARETVCEAAVFCCYAASETRPITELFAARGEFLSRYEPSIRAIVSVKGRYVLFAAGEDPKTVLAVLSRALK